LDHKKFKAKQPVFTFYVTLGELRSSVRNWV